MRVFYRWTLRMAAGLLGLNATAFTQIIDFESAPYVTDKSIVDLDGWTKSSDPVLEYPDNFKIQTGPGGRWIHALTTTQTTLYRSYPSFTGVLDVRWKWRGLSDSVHFCIGPSNGNASARAASRGLACMEPYGEITLQGSGLTPSPTEATWKAGVWHYMRMVLDNSANGTNKFTVYMSDDSLRGVERQLALPMTMGGLGGFTRIVMRDELGGGFVDIDDISDK